MWANPWGGSWSIQQSAVQNMRHDEVDWASLAKQWIAQREAAQVIQQEEHNQILENLAQQPPPPAPAEPHPDSSVPERQQPNQQDENSMDISDEESDISAKHAGASKNGFSGHGPLLPTPSQASDQQRGGGGDWGRSWHPPGPQEQWQEESSQDDFNYNQGSAFGGNFPPSGDMFFQGGGPQMASNFQQQFWPPQGPGVPPPAMPAEGFSPQIPFPAGPPSQLDDRHGHAVRSRPYHGDPYTSGRVDDSGIDSAKRKQLPAWIREGLEKMEREKQRQAEKEKMEKEKLEAQRAKEEAEKQAAEELRREQEENATGEARVPRKSRFDSDEEDDEEVSRTASLSPKEAGSSSPEVKKRSPSPEQFKTEEEKQMELMMKVKQWMMEILLDVTSSMISEVAHQVYDKAKVQALKAPAKVLAKSSALASLSSLGLGYGSGSSDEDSEGSNYSDSDSEQDVKKPTKPRTSDKEKIFSDEDSDYHAEPAVPECLKNPLSKDPSLLSFKKEESIPGIDSVRKEGKGEIHPRESDQSKPKNRENEKVERARGVEGAEVEMRVREEQNESVRSKPKVTVKKEESTGTSASSSESSSESSSSSSSESSSSQESDPKTKSKKKKKPSKRDKNSKVVIHEKGILSEDWIEKQSDKKRKETVESEKHKKREFSEEREGGTDRKKSDRKRHKDKDRGKDKKRKRGHSEDRSRDRVEGVRDRGKHKESSTSQERDRGRKRRRSMSDDQDSDVSSRDEYERRRNVSSSPEAIHSRSRDRERRRRRSISRERGDRSRGSYGREGDRYEDYGWDSHSRSGDSDEERSRRRSRSREDRRSKRSKRTESKSKSRKRRRSRSGSSGSDRGSHRRTSKDSSSVKRRRESRRSDRYEASGKKSRKHKSRSRSRSSSPRRR